MTIRIQPQNYKSKMPICSSPTIPHKFNNILDVVYMVPMHIKFNQTDYKNSQICCMLCLSVPTIYSYSPNNNITSLLSLFSFVLDVGLRSIWFIVYFNFCFVCTWSYVPTLFIIYFKINRNKILKVQSLQISPARFPFHRSTVGLFITLWWILRI